MNEVAVAPRDLEIVLGMVPALWRSVHVGLAESLTVLQMYKMTVVVAEVDTAPSDLEMVLSVASACRGTGQGTVLHGWENMRAIDLGDPEVFQSALVHSAAVHVNRFC